MKKELYEPQVGQDVYLPTQLYISRGSDDFAGGLAQVTKVKQQISGGKLCVFIEVAEHPGASYNWTMYLAPKQDEYKEQYGNERAHPDPDIDTPWIEAGDIVNGKVYKGPPIW